MGNLLDFIAQLYKAGEHGDEETLRLSEATRDKELGAAEEAFFSSKLGALAQNSQRLLLLDLGGPPDLGVKLLQSCPSQTKLFYFRADPNPASRRVTYDLLAPLSSIESRLVGADPTAGQFSEGAWRYISSRVDCVVVLLGGGVFNAFGEGDDASAQKAFADSILRHVNLSLVSLVLPERLPQCIERLRSVKKYGALFDTVRVRHIRREEGQLILGEEISSPLESEPQSFPEGGYLSLGVAVGDSPTFVLAKLFSLSYLQSEILHGFQLSKGPLVGESQLFVLQYVH